jgi:hypothetical protein
VFEISRARELIEETTRLTERLAALSMNEQAAYAQLGAFGSDESLRSTVITSRYLINELVQSVTTILNVLTEDYADQVQADDLGLNE